MAVAGSLQLSHDLGLCRNQGCNKQFKDILGRSKLPLLSTRHSLCSSFHFRQHDLQSIQLSGNLYRPIHSIPYRSNAFRCNSFLGPSQAFQLPCKKAVSVAFKRSYNVIQGSPIVLKLASAIGVIMFSIWGIEPLLRQSRNLLLRKNDNSWKKSGTNYVLISYIQPLLLWAGAILICRTLDPVVLPTEASQIVKQRLLNFLRSLSTVLAFAYCLSSIIQQAQKFFMESVDTIDTRNMGFQFAGKAVYSAVWVAAASLFMELLGFSTQKWLTAGGLGTVLLTLAGREIFTNFLSSAMIHATRPFVVNEWIQTKIEGYEVSGTVEHVGWWSPTIVRGEDREAVHIPNHKFTVNVVRNLTQKSHWRIKTHLAISHLDAHKIHNIVADMRKVLAKNPQVEQQRLHRRVFLDNVNPENQALLILISCFVKTSHHEEYLCVKETILLDLLRVISHHRARLATPIRTVQKIYSDADLENVPFADSIFNRGGVGNRPLLLIEPSYKINGEDKAKSQTRSGRVGPEQDKAVSPSTPPDTKSGAGSKSDVKSKEAPKSDSKVDPKTIQTPNSDPKVNRKAATVAVSDPKIADMMTVKPSPNSAPKNAETSHSSIKAADSVPDDSAQNKKVSDIKQANSSSAGNLRQNSNIDAVSSPESSGLQEADRKPVPQQSKSRSSLEENLVLGVALEGSKRTLPIEEDMVSHPSLADAKETATSRRNGPGSTPAEKERKDGQTPSSPTATSEH